MARTLYICYFGLLEPLVQTQVLPYLREIEKGGTEVSIITFEPDFRNRWSQEQITEEKAKLAANGIDWHYLKYHKWPSVPATLYDIFRGTLFVRRFVNEQKPDILHGRAHLPTLMGAIARNFSRHKPKLLFDIRGLFPEEYTDAGIWPEGGWLYRGAKGVERWLLKKSDGFVVLTERAREMLFPEAKETNFDKEGRPIEVIPCCVDMSRFESANPNSRSEMRKNLGLDGRFVAAYIGAFGGWYLTKETADFLGELRAYRKDAFALVLTQSKPELIEPLLKQRGYGEGDYLVAKVNPREIPRYLCGADVAVSFIKRCYSKQASSPTKNAEYLACGLPIIANSGVGDVDRLILENGVGILTDGFTRESYLRVLNGISVLGDVKEKCRNTAFRQFDLENIGGERYRRLYRRLLGNDKIQGK
jgi:glycosyltransferase involved in cell wall biosynthesis